MFDIFVPGVHRDALFLFRANSNIGANSKSDSVANPIADSLSNRFSNSPANTIAE
jgi:hypothetical protein